MSDGVVCDASAVIALLLDSGSDGQWTAAWMTNADLFAPTLLPYECANVIRRLERGGVVSPDQAAQAYSDLLDLSVELWPYDLLAARVWELRTGLSSYDASYVALAELLAVPLVTLDRRIRQAPAVSCVVAVPGTD